MILCGDVYQQLNRNYENRRDEYMFVLKLPFTEFKKENYRNDINYENDIMEHEPGKPDSIGKINV